ncbi:unnamed protein product [Sphagnum jensenii]|uniref:Uncharacterized protein n=1 Tax=Sphagnum jensenii TaxID=128206 RepID=A0ABP0XKI5_9BRYO
MAVSAFKSTTRRSCNIRGLEVVDVLVATSRSRNTSPVRRSSSAASRPTSPVKRMPSATPRSRPTSPTNKQQQQQQQVVAKHNERLHRRTRSFADLSSSQYFTDSSSTPAPPPPPPESTTTRRHGGISSSFGPRSSARQLPSDSESEAEPRYMMRRSSSERRRYGSDNESSVHSVRESSVHRPAAGHSKHSYRQPNGGGGLRRSMSQLELSQPRTPVYYRKGNLPSEEDEHHPLQPEDGEVQVEEKTIRAVHTQTKVQTLCYNCLYDVSSSAEVSTDFISAGGSFKMVAKLQGNSIEPPSRETDAINMHDAMWVEIRRAVAEARNELEQSVSKDPLAQSLHAISNDVRKEYATKLEQAEKKVQGLWSQLAIEEQQCLDLVGFVKELFSRQQETLQAQQRSSLVLRDDKDIMRESLDEEAQRYFEECVSIAKLEPTGVDSLMVSQEKDILSTENEEPFDWPVETDSDSMLCFDDTQEVTQRADHVRNSSIQNIAETSFVGKPAGKTKDCAPLDDEGMLLPWLDWEPEVDTLNRKERVEKAAVDFREWRKAWARKSVEWGKSMKRERGKDEGAVNVDEFLFERVRLWQRITHGRVLICGGKR